MKGSFTARIHLIYALCVSRLPNYFGLRTHLERRFAVGARIPTRFQSPHSREGFERDYRNSIDGLPHFVWKDGLLAGLEKFYGYVVHLDEILYLSWIDDDDDEDEGYLEAHVRRREDGKRDIIRFKGTYGH